MPPIVFSNLAWQVHGERLTAPDPSVDGPPKNAIILAPEPGTHTPNK